MKTVCPDREVWYDGCVAVGTDSAVDLLLQGVPQEKIVILDPGRDLELFNRLSDVEIATFKNTLKDIKRDWNIPAHALNIDLKEFIFSRASGRGLCSNSYQSRINAELALIEQHGIVTLFKTLIWVIGQLRSNNIVWGVGRGSSCASLILFIIGLHCVDPVKYKIPLEEFFHD